MRYNPEFRRNLWVEMKKSKLVAMPLVLCAAFFIVYLLNDSILNEEIAWVGILLYVLFVFVGGTRQAAEAISREANLGTWWSQRMSAVGPWKMTWGKLFGATSFMWLGGFLSLIFYVLCMSGEIHGIKSDDAYSLIKRLLNKEITWETVIINIISYISLGVLAQSISMLSSLYSMQYRRNFERFEVLFFQFLGAVLAFPVLQSALTRGVSWDSGVISWYGVEYAKPVFMSVVILSLIVWSIIGIYTIMRSEFRLENSPMIWLSFVSYMVILVIGVNFEYEARFTGGYQFPIPIGGLLAFNLLFGLMYLMACGESRDALRLHLLKHCIKERRYKKLFSILPRTVVTLPVAIVFISYIVTQVRQPFPGEKGYMLMQVMPYCIVASFFFMVRDICFIYYFAVKRKGKTHNNVFAILVLLMTYTLIPAILYKFEANMLLSFFLPWPQEEQVFLTMMPAMGQAFAMMALLTHEWYLNKGLPDVGRKKA